jgi:hypothetical protein
MRMALGEVRPRVSDDVAYSSMPADAPGQGLVRTLKKKPWFKFYPDAWRGDDKLNACSLAAQGLWMRCLCIMHEGEPCGYLRHGGKPMAVKKLAELVRISGRSCEKLLHELEENGVFSRDELGIFSRRMVHDQALAQVRGQHGVESLEHPTVMAMLAAAKEPIKGGMKGPMMGSLES